MANEEMSNGFSSFIVELSVNNTEEDREKSRARLQEQYEACDTKLSGLVKEHRGNLSSTVQLCSKVIHSVNESKSRCRALQDRITKCMDLLQCNRENIRRMWLESLQHKYAHKILSEIEEMRTIPREVNESLINKKLEHATEVIVNSVKLLNGSLCNADALKDLRLELQNLQEKLYGMILEDLRRYLHWKEFISSYFIDSLKEVTYEDVFIGNEAAKSDYSFKERLNKITFDKAYITVLLNCIVMMKRVPDAMEFLKENCQVDLTNITYDISKLMYDVIETSVDSAPFELPVEKQHIFLVDLIESVTSVAQKLLSNYNDFFSTLQPFIEMHAITDLQFQLEDVYSKLQASIESFIGLYLESNSSLYIRDSFAFENSQNMGGISSFFSTQPLTDDKHLSLFKFSNSCFGMDLKKQSKNTKAFELEIDEAEENQSINKLALVCRPTIRNITLIYNRLMSFVSDIEKSLNLNDGEHCPLHTFLSDSANSFLDHVNSDINKMLKNASANLDAWNTSPVNEGTRTEKEVLSCSLILGNILKELQNLMNYMPDYVNHFLRLLYYVILDYKDMYQLAFKQMFEEEQNVLSVSWARDRDIRRLMKSFLNWRHLEDEETVDVIESPEEIRLRNKEESELLIRNLRSEDEASCEIITDSNKLSNLALLQENLICFSVDLLKFIKNFNQSYSKSEIAPSSSDTDNSEPISNTLSGLRKVIKEYEDFADMCLLALHLEVRARCFHYLLAFSSQEIYIEGSFLQEFDTAVKHLTSDLLQIDEVLLPILTPKEFKYVFEGLGELVASLMILIASNMNKINEAAVRKIDRNIVTVQCCLANITMAREISMERSRQFIDLLKSTHEEILDQIVEEGPRFNQQEYACVFRLISASVTESRRNPEYYLDKLKLIFERLSSKTNEQDPPIVP